MATLLLGAVGASLGGSVGGSILGVGGAAIGRAMGAIAGRAIDQRLMGSAAAAVDHGRVDRFHVSGAAEGTVLPRLHGRMRLAGHVIWASPFRHAVTTTGGGGGRKGGGRAAVRTHSYSVSLALALCEGPIRSVGRVWADGVEVADGVLSMRVHHGDEDQLPDGIIEAHLGADAAPAFRGTAYVVIEDLDLAPFGNRVPQFSFEVVRGVSVPGQTPAPQDLLRGITIIPGTGEYALSTRRVDYRSGGVGGRVGNVHNAWDVPDFVASLRQLRQEVPGLRTASLVVSWFADDLRCGSCRLRPMVEQTHTDGAQMPWQVSGLTRRTAPILPKVDGRSVHGGTPADASVIEAIRAIRDGGQEVTYHPFLLTTQVAGNGLPDPYGDTEQARLPWRGRITTSVAPGREGSSDGTPAAEAEVAAFFGAARARDFVVDDGTVSYMGAADWGYRRFVLHQAALCAAAGGVEAFVLGSELVGLTRVRGVGGLFPAVEALRALAREVRYLLPMAQIGYAADWTEYGAHSPVDGAGDLYFPLDPLWSDPEVDFVGVNFYAPLSDWRDGEDHADAAWESGHALDYLQANVEGGEGYTWYYATPGDRDGQVRRAIEDGAHGEPWVYRQKDLRSWWSNAHHERRDGARAANATGWIPGSKPIRLIEFGCGAVDKGALAPNRFPDPRSSEGGLPPYSSGLRDDAMQVQYLRAFLSYWNAEGRNPRATAYIGSMIDLDRSCAWAWDARPWPAFPSNEMVWSDGPNHATGHWLTGRLSLVPLASIIADVCERNGVRQYDVARVRDVVRGQTIDRLQDGRADLQPLLLAYDVGAAEVGGVLHFFDRKTARSTTIEADGLVRQGGMAVLEEAREAILETAGRVLVRHASATGSSRLRVSGRSGAADCLGATNEIELPLALTEAEALGVADRLLMEATTSQATITFAVPPSRHDLCPGDVAVIVGRLGEWRIDRMWGGTARSAEATLVTRAIDLPSAAGEATLPLPEAQRPPTSAPITALLMDLPLQSDNAVRVVASARPWPGPMAVLSATSDEGYEAEVVVTGPTMIGLTETPLPAASPGALDRGSGVEVSFEEGLLSPVPDADLFAGANAAAIGNGEIGSWEVVRFRDVVRLGQNRWRLSTFLRGLHGSDAVMPDRWPVGSYIVLLDGSGAGLGQSDAPKDIVRHFRIGPAHLAWGHERFVHLSGSVRGRADAPLSPVHLIMTRTSGGDRFEWTRRTRIGGEGWEREVPLGETSERYSCIVTIAGRIVWEGVVDRPYCEVPAALRDTIVGGGYIFHVAQVSDTFGPGPAAILHVA